MRFLLFSTIFCVLLFTGCASDHKDLSAQYVSPNLYKDYDCNQIAEEMHHLERRTGVLYHQLKAERTADEWQTATGVFLIIPLFWLEGGDSPVAAEFTRVKGEHEALRTVSIQKKCSYRGTSPDEIMHDIDEEERKHKNSSQHNSHNNTLHYAYDRSYGKVSFSRNF